jgi:Fur family transcriptional regulator, ferric uptake regulator
MNKNSEYKDLFQGQIFRWTLTRQAILDLLRRTSEHMSAKEIYYFLLEKYPGIGLSTVYRTLDLLSQMGLINKMDIGEGQSRYEYRTGEERSHHHHLICKKCGKIIDYDDFVDEEIKLVKEEAKSIKRKYKFIVQDHNIEFYGLCKDCQ